MNDLIPITEEPKKPELTSIEEPKPINNNSMPILKQTNEKDEIIQGLPEWNIEPPIEIKRT